MATSSNMCVTAGPEDDKLATRGDDGSSCGQGQGCWHQQDWWDRPERGLPVGAVVVLCPSKVHTVKSALAQAKWLKPGLCVTGDSAHGGAAMAVHVSHGGAMALADSVKHHHPEHREESRRDDRGAPSSRDEHDEQQTCAGESTQAIPLGLREALDSGVALWVPGLRVRSKRCRRSGNGNKAATATEAVCPQGTVTSTVGRCIEARSHTAADADALLSSKSESTPHFRFVELFAGIGGFRVALEALGGKAVFASEIDREAVQTYNANFREATRGGGSAGDGGDDVSTQCQVVGDITEIDAADIPDHDILTAGFPCQPFSRAGPARSFDDDALIVKPRRDCQVLDRKRPRAFVLENVANLVDVNRGNDLDIIISRLSSVGGGYDVSWRVINARAVLPQQRMRIFIVGTKRGAAAAGASDTLDWPELPVIDTVLRPLLEPTTVSPAKRGDGPHMCAATSAAILTDHQLEKVKSSDSWRIDPALRLARLDGGARTLMASYLGGFALKSEFVWDKGAPRPRFYTPRECARMQGFPESFKLGGILRNPRRVYHQLGNAVSPVVAAAVCAAVLKAVGVDLSIDADVKDLPPLPRSVCARREVVRPCLRLLLAATPTSSREHIERQCCSFLLAGADDNEEDIDNTTVENVPLATAGYGSSGFTARDAVLATRLLQRNASEAECIAGLCAVARAAHYPDTDGEDVGHVPSADGKVAGQRLRTTSALTHALTHGGLLDAVVRQVTSPASDEAARLAVVTLINLCTEWTADAAPPLATGEFTEPSPPIPTTSHMELVRNALDADAISALHSMRERAMCGSLSDQRFANQLDRLAQLVGGNDSSSF